MGVSSDPTFAVSFRQYPESVSVLRILQPDGGGCPVIECGALVAVHELEDGMKQCDGRIDKKLLRGANNRLARRRIYP
jgi:hypothetical protein